MSREFPIIDGAFDPACSGCGACCSNKSEKARPINICIFSDAELDRFPADVRHMVVRGEDGSLGFPTLRRNGFDSCCYLQGDIGFDAGCGIHQVKPTECRWFLPGSSNCLQARRNHGLPKDKDPVLRRDAREGTTGALLLRMREHLGEIPNSIAGRGPADHYSYERDRQAARKEFVLLRYRTLETKLKAMRDEHSGEESPDEEDLLERMSEAWLDLTDQQRATITREGPKTLIKETS